MVSGGQQRDLARNHSPPNSPPTQAATWPWAESPELYSRSLLVIHFKCSSVYTSIPNSLAILSSHASSLATVSLFSKSVSLKLNFLKVISNLIFQSSGEMEIIYPGNSDCLTDESFLLWHEAPTLGSCVFSPLPSLVLYVYLKWARLVQTFQPLSRGH